jgi:hypothetical protein
VPQPDRPFVPHRTPKRAPPVVAASEFHLYRPFVPGSERASAEPNTLSPMTVESQAEKPISLRPIEDFLHTPAPAPAALPPVTSSDPYVAEFEAQPDELPPVEHFMDPLPVVDIFAPDTKGASSDSAPAASAPAARTDIPPSEVNAADSLEMGWLETDWQHYDWHAAAALGEGVDDATRAWATTDWDGAAAPPRSRPPTADSIATALNEIARRLRDGELAVPGSGATTDPATIAATLAALLGVRR